MKKKSKSKALGALPKMAMPWYAKVIAEKHELNKKISSLQLFINSVEYVELEDNHRRLLNSQLEHMLKYSKILRDRLVLSKEIK